MVQDGLARPRRPLLRALYAFWGVVLSLFVAGGVTLQMLGPPAHRPIAEAQANGGATVREAMATPGGLVTGSALHAPAPAAAAPRPNADTLVRPVAIMPPGTPIAPPDPALLEVSSEFPNAKLPKIGADHRTPMQVYAAGTNPADPHPRVAILVAGIGMSEADSDEAVRSTPPAISLAVSPYALRPEHLLDSARAKGHELFVSIPMEPQGFPLNDAGNRALLTGAPPLQNMERLDWALSRIEGYVGATGALEGSMRGERFSATEQMGQVLEQLAQRGLMYVDAAPSVLRPQSVVNVAVASRGVDVVVDEPAVRTEIDDRLARLERIAQERGTALGLIGVPRPVSIARIAAWSATLAARGITLVPVSALIMVPAPAPIRTSGVR